MIEQGGVAQTEMMVRTIADGLRAMFQGLLRLVIRHQDKPRTVKLRGEWVEFDPRHWNAEMDASINVGLGAGTRERDMMMMQMIIGLQERIVAALGPDNPFVKPENVYNSFEELVRAAGIKTPDRFVTNPDPQEIAQRLEMARNKPDPEMIKANAAMQVEQMKAQIAMQVKQADMEVQTNKERAQMEADLRVKAAEMEKDAIARREELEADAIKEEQKANLEREKMAQARELKLLELAQQRELAVMSSGVEQAESGVQQVIEAIQMLTSQIEGLGARDSAPRRIVRDPVTGDIVGVEVDGGSARRVVRDPASGDIIGVETIQ
jgi:NADH dehydrogenase/NADH:ubiquinone oxidoreductase subunit G